MMICAAAKYGSMPHKTPTDAEKNRAYQPTVILFPKLPQPEHRTFFLHKNSSFLGLEYTNHMFYKKTAACGTGQETV